MPAAEHVGTQLGWGVRTHTHAHVPPGTRNPPGSTDGSQCPQGPGCQPCARCQGFPGATSSTLAAGTRFVPQTLSPNDPVSSLPTSQPRMAAGAGWGGTGHTGQTGSECHLGTAMPGWEPATIAAKSLSCREAGEARLSLFGLPASFLHSQLPLPCLGLTWQLLELAATFSHGQGSPENVRPGCGCDRARLRLCSLRRATGTPGMPQFPHQGKGGSSGATTRMDVPSHVSSSPTWHRSNNRALSSRKPPQAQESQNGADAWSLGMGMLQRRPRVVPAPAPHLGHSHPDSLPAPHVVLHPLPLGGPSPLPRPGLFPSSSAV